MDRLTGDVHPGDWRLHHTWRSGAPGDFRPVKVPDYHEEEISRLRCSPELLGGDVPEHSQAVCNLDRSPEREAGS